MKKIFTYFLFRTNFNQAIAEDLTQDTFYLAFKNFYEFKIKTSSYLSYLITIAHNLLVNFYKKKNTLALEKAENIPAEVLESWQQKIELGRLWKSVERLPKNSKQVIQLYYQKGQSIRTIARLLHKSENAVKLLLSRARKELRQKMLTPLI